MDLRVLFLFFLVAATVVSVRPAAGAQLFVAPDGSDQNPGTTEKPLATLAKARDLARAARAKQPGPLTILLRSGT